MVLATSSVTAPKRRPRLRTVLLVVNLLILLLPLASIAALHVYENELIRSTEAQLLVQGAFVREAYREAYLLEQGVTIVPAPAPAPGAPTILDDSRVLVPQLDMGRDRVLPPAPPARPGSEADPHALAAGSKLARGLEAATRETLTGIRVVDMRGIVVATSGGEEGMTLADREEVQRALRGERLSLLRKRVSDEPIPPLRSLSRGQRYRIFVALPVDVDGRVIGAVVLSRTPLDIGKALFLHRQPLILGGAAVLAVVVLVSALSALTIVRPARELTARAERVARGERGAVEPLPEPGTHEMARLSEAIAAMARTLEERAEYIRTFASHVSHEFKTPLATIRGTVELLRDHLGTMTPEERERFLEILQGSSEHLDRLVRRLLELARADVLSPGHETTEIGAALERVAAKHAGTDLEVITPALAEQLGSVVMSSDVLDGVLGHLLDNARTHGGQSVRVCLSARPIPGAVPPAIEIRVADDGVGISEPNASRVFTPFFTTARQRGGSGLGLSIVRSLVEAHRGTVRLERGGQGATFVIQLPAAPRSNDHEVH